VAGWWYRQCESEAEARTLYDALKRRGVLVARVGDGLAGLGDERVKASMILAEVAPDSRWYAGWYVSRSRESQRTGESKTQ
jgi:hypothetical protein